MVVDRVQIQGTAKRKSVKTKSVTIKLVKIFKDQKWFLRVLFNHIVITFKKIESVSLTLLIKH